MQTLRSRLTFGLGAYFGLLLSAGTTLVGSAPAKAQSITAADDGTGSMVTPAGSQSGDRQTGTQYTIEAGSLSENGLNLFHSFQTFSLQAGEGAYFIAGPTVQNVLARVNGGAPSIINGQLSLSAAGTGSPNFFFMNPAGVLFGPQAGTIVETGRTTPVHKSTKGFSGALKMTWERHHCVCWA